MLTRDRKSREGILDRPLFGSRNPAWAAIEMTVKIECAENSILNIFLKTKIGAKMYKLKCIASDQFTKVRGSYACIYGA